MSKRKETKYIIIHSTETKPSVDLSARDIDERHRKKGLLKIGYHFVIRRDGTINVGRPLCEIGAHLQKQDKKSVGVCMVGGLNTRGIEAPDYSVQQQQALFVLIKFLKLTYKDAVVVGHNTFEATSCPSFNIEKWWAERSKIEFEIGGLYGSR